MKNLISNIIYNDVTHQYEFIDRSSRIDFEDRLSPIDKMVTRKMYNEIDQVKKTKLRRIPNPLKYNA